MYEEDIQRFAKKADKERCLLLAIYKVCAQQRFGQRGVKRVLGSEPDARRVHIDNDCSLTIVVLLLVLLVLVLVLVLVVTTSS
jgi:hypothetical protein